MKFSFTGIIPILVILSLVSAGCTNPAQPAHTPPQTTSNPVATITTTTAPPVATDRINPKLSPDTMFSGEYRWVEYRNTITQTLPPNPRYSWNTRERVERSNGTYQGIPAVHYRITETGDYGEWVDLTLVQTKDGMITVTDRYFDAVTGKFLGGTTANTIKGNPEPPAQLPDYPLDPEDRPSYEMGITPFGEMDMDLAGAGTESVTVPAGTYPDARKYTGSFRDGTPITFRVAKGVPVPVHVPVSQQIS